MHGNGGSPSRHVAALASSPLDGIIAIAPGGNVGSPSFREQLGESVRQARDLIAAGKGEEKARFLDFEGSRVTYAIVCTPANYLGWFDPEGAMNESIAVKGMNPDVPVLFIVPKEALLRAKQPMFISLPRNTLTRLYEPNSSHLGAPAAALGEIERWINEVANAANGAGRGNFGRHDLGRP